MEDDPLGVKSREVFSMGLAGGRGISSQDTLGWPTLCEFVSRKGWVTPVEIMVHIFLNRSAGTRACQFRALREIQETIYRGAIPKSPSPRISKCLLHQRQASCRRVLCALIFRNSRSSNNLPIRSNE